MPTYEYECTKCGHAFEEFQSIHEPPRSRCPKCRGKVQRLVGTGAGIVFKGSGWYVTDSRSKGGKGGGDGAKPTEKKCASESPATEKPAVPVKEGTDKGSSSAAA